MYTIFEGLLGGRGSTLYVRPRTVLPHIGTSRGPTNVLLELWNEPESARDKSELTFGPSQYPCLDSK